tara:strand:- start:20893 stop:21585 length:693 start_codon:yes stop_codon:yes gene_type:complete
MPGIFQDWKFKEGHVQSVPEGGDFLSSESCVICAGPNTIPETIQNVVPIGLVQNATVTQNKQIQQLYEIGSRQPIFIPGRTVVQAALSRILFDGPSLMRAVYKIYNGSNIITDQSVPVDSGTNPENAPGNPYVTDDDQQAKFYINLASEFFNKPLGLAFFLNDMEDENYGGFYLENCYIQSHQLSIAGQQTILVENVGIRCSRVVPINRAGENDIDTAIDLDNSGSSLAG